MPRHAGPPIEGPTHPEPSLAERARTLAQMGRNATLATLSRRHPGHPFASVMPYALDEMGQPLVLISSMAMHTQNVAADARASLLVTQSTSGDPLAAARLTFVGSMRRIEAAERERAKATYLARHANASYWVDFDDFGFWRLDPAELYFVGGFGVMDWVSPADYAAAAPDPLAETAESILRHLNDDHAPALLTLARTASAEPADEATIVSIDRLGFRLRLSAGDRMNAVRLSFPREVRTPAECRDVFVEMLRARS